MSTPPYITKGTHVHAHWFQVKPIGSVALTGVMMKTDGQFVDVVGVCAHFRGDDPVNPSKVIVYVTPDPDTWDGPMVRPDGGCSCSNLHVAINPDHIVRVG